MRLLQRIRDLSVGHDVAFLVAAQPKCDCDDNYFAWEVYRRLWRTSECVRVARTSDLNQAFDFLRAEVEAIEQERVDGTVVRA